MVDFTYISSNQIITLKDNLFHPYFSYISIAKDTISPLGICKMEMPYMQQALDYWIKYDGIVVISFSIEETSNEEYLNSLKQDNNIKNNEYNYSFIGKIQKIKHKGNLVVIYLEDIGWKFEQKVPKDFRESYIAGRSLDEAFQAICQFLDVRFAYSIDYLNGYTFGVDGYSIQKDGQTIDEVQNIFEIIKSNTTIDENNIDELDIPDYENEGLIDFGNSNLLAGTTEKLLDVKSKNDKEKAIEEKKQKLQKSFDEKIKDLIVGNKYYDSNLTSVVLNYGGITLEPQNPQDNSSLNEIGSENNENNNGGNSNDAKYTDKNRKRTQEIRNALEMKSKKKQVLDTKTYQKINQLNQNHPVEQSTSTTQQNPAFYRTFYKPKITVQK